MLLVAETVKNCFVYHRASFNFFLFSKRQNIQNPIRDTHVLLNRECIEEIGCRIEVIDVIGQIIEERKFCSLRQISDCYFAKLVGAKGKPSFEQDEIKEGFTEIWVDYDKAIELLSHNEAVGLEGHAYIVPRDEIFLRAAKVLVESNHS